MEDVFTSTMRVLALNFAEWLAREYPLQQIEGQKRIWRKASLKEDFSKGKTTEEVYDLFVEDERKRISLPTVSVVKSGRTFNSSHGDSGVVVHITHRRPENSVGFWGGKALCGSEPGKRSNGWYHTANFPTCPKCIIKQNETK